VVLENVFRHIQRGEDRLTAALNATREAGDLVRTGSMTITVTDMSGARINQVLLEPNGAIRTGDAA
jgi:hypothetical protein